MRRALLLTLLLFGASCHAAHPQHRPLAVPSTAAWAGGANGGAWVDCWRVSDEERAEAKASGQSPPVTDPALDAAFDCRVFDARGAIQQKARFRLLDVDDAHALHPAADPRRVMQYRGWDGCRVLLEGERVLVPEKKTACANGVCTDRC